MTISTQAEPKQAEATESFDVVLYALMLVSLMFLSIGAAIILLPGSPPAQSPVPVWTAIQSGACLMISMVIAVWALAWNLRKSH